jgi:hypothetical protein
VTVTINVPLTTISAQRTFGPSAIADSFTQIEFLINRNVGPQPIDQDALAGLTVLTLECDDSINGGNTWNDLGQATVAGGKLIATRGPQAGQEMLQSGGSWTLDQGTGRQIRGIVTPDQTISLSGTITAS